MLISKADQTTRATLSQARGSYENWLVGVLGLTFGVVMTDRLALNFLSPFITAELDLNNAEIGALASGLAVTWAISGIVVSRFSGLAGRQRLVLCLSVVAFSICSLLSGFATSFGVLLATRLLMGISEGPVLPISHVLLARESTPSRRGFNMGAMQMLGSNILGIFLAPVLLVFVAEHWGWRRAFFVAGVPGLFCALALWKVIRVPAASDVSMPGMAALAEIWPLLRSRNIVLCMLIAGLMVAWTLLCFVFLPLYFTKVSGLSPRVMSFLMSSIGVAAICSGLLVSALSDRIGRKPVVIGFTCIALVVPVGVAVIGPSVPLLTGALFVGFLAAGAAPLVMATIPAETAPGPHVGTVVAIVIGVAEVFAGVGGPLVGGFIADRFGLPATLYLQAGILIAAVMLGCFLTETAPHALGEEIRPRVEVA